MNDIPADDAFKQHYEDLLLDSTAEDIRNFDITSSPSIPVLDDPLSINEIEEAVQRMKPNKSCGPDGISPGVLRILPAAWILHITTLFNAIFLRGIKPLAWQAAKLISIFKSGARPVLKLSWYRRI